MKNSLALIAFSLLPAVALAGGSHAGSHAMKGSHDTMQDKTHASSVGRPGDTARITRTVEVTMDDSMRFAPNKIAVKAGETIRFRARNAGKVQHEMVIGAMDELQAHAEMMRKFPSMEHEEPNTLTLEPGAKGELVWQFDQPGTVDFACLIPGHLEAGMIARVTVTGTKG